MTIDNKSRYEAQKEMKNNICIGHGAGEYIINEMYQLCLKSKELDIDLIHTMTKKEYELISKVVAVMDSHSKKQSFPIHHSGCSACRTGSCSIHIGHKSGTIK